MNPTAVKQLQYCKKDDTATKKNRNKQRIAIPSKPVTSCSAAAQKQMLLD